MKIIVVADTHLPRKNKMLPERLVNELKGCDYIFHAGDWKTIEVYECFKSYGTVFGVSGNVDDQAVKDQLPRSINLELEGYKFGITHGDGKGKYTEKRALDMFSSEPLDCVIYGHSHIPVLKKINNQIVFNPGSPTDKRKEKFFSFGIITIDQTLHIEHVFFE